MKHFISLPLNQILTKPARSFSYVVIELILIFPPLQNILFYRGTSPILNKGPWTSQNIGIRVDRSFLLRFLRFKYVRNHKNVSDFSVIFVDFISRGDTPNSSNRTIVPEADCFVSWWTFSRRTAAFSQQHKSMLPSLP